MKLSHAIEQVRDNGQRSKVTQGDFKPNDKIEIYIQSVGDFRQTNDYLRQLRLSRISSKFSSSQDKNRRFVVQISERGDSKMSDIDKNLETDVLEEEVFDSKSDGIEWIQQTGYF